MQLLYKNERYGLNDEKEKVLRQNNTEFKQNSRVTNLPFLYIQNKISSPILFFIIYLHFIHCKLIKNELWIAQRLLVKR